MLAKYTPSGAFTSRLFVGAPVVLAGTAALGAVYQLITHYVPFIKAHLLIAILMCFAIVVLVRQLAKTAHCRNRLLGTSLGVVAGLVAITVSHYVEYELSRPGLIASVPPAQRAAVDAHFGFIQFLEFRVETGWTLGHGSSTSSGSGDISGVGVYVCWGIEALLILISAGIGGYRAASAPYCEQCGTWATHDMLRVETPQPSADLVAGVRSARELDQLFPPASSVGSGIQGDISLLRYSVTSCPTCKMTHTLKVEHQQVTVTGKKTEKKKHVLHDKVVLTSEEVGRLAQLKGVPVS
ncbi:MAG: hypothetical protein QM783_05780 [Phycisphaerales bacterium]